MGLFDVFKKKECCICGNEVGLIGNRKLADGNMCSKCTKGLSPWFADRKQSTVAQIKAQLAYREQNSRDLENFTVSRCVGENYKMYIEEVNGVPVRFFVSDAQDYREDNPDILSFKDVVSCVTDIDVRDEEEKKRDKEGNLVSYNPPRFKHHHDFYIRLQIRDNPYFDEMYFRINDSEVVLESVGGFAGVTGHFSGGQRMGAARAMAANLSGSAAYANARERRRYNDYQQMCQMIEQAVEDGKHGIQPVVYSSGASAQTVPEPPVQDTPKPKFCPNCGAPYEGGKFCQSCGSKL